MCQLLITLIFVVIATTHAPTKQFIQDNYYLRIIAIVITFSILIALACCDQYRRKKPLNYILLFVFTIAESFLVAVFSSKFYTQHVVLALSITTLLCFVLTIFAIQTKIDFTVFGGFLLIALVVLLVVMIVGIFFPSKLFIIIIASAGAIIFSLYLIYDTQLMMGGNHKYSVSPEEYIFAALNIYVDVINIFIFILTLIGASEND